MQASVDFDAENHEKREEKENSISYAFDVTSLINQEIPKQSVEEEDSKKDQNHNEEFHELDNSTYINWKKEKLEKEFLLKYLEKTLEKYGRYSCNSRNITSRYRSFSQKVDEPLGRENAQTKLTRLKGRSALQMIKDKGTETDTVNTTPINKYQTLIKTSYFIANAIDRATKTKKIEPLLNLNFNDVSKLKQNISRLYKDDILSDNIVDKQLEEVSDYSKEQMLGNDDFKQKIEPIENAKGKNKSKKAPKQQLVKKKILNTTIIEPTIVTPPVKKKASVNFENINEPSSLKLFENYVPIDDTAKYEFENICKNIDTHLAKSDQNIRSVFGNKRLFYATVILISEASQRFLHQTPLLDGLSHSMLSLHTDAKLAKSFFMDDLTDEIFNEFNHIGKFLTNIGQQIDPIKNLLEEIAQLIKETTAAFDPITLNIIGDETVLTEFMSLIQYLSGSLDPVLMNTYLDNLQKSQTDDADTSNSDESWSWIKDVLSNIDLLSHVLVVIHIWCVSAQQQGSGTFELSSTNPSYDSVTEEYIQSDIEALKLWISKQKKNSFETSVLASIYDNVANVTFTTTIPKLRNIFNNLHALHELITLMPVTTEICLRANDIYRLFNKEINEKDVDNKTDKIQLLVSNIELLRQFLIIVNYLTDDFEEELNYEKLLSNYSHETKSTMLIKLFTLSNSMSQMEEHCRFSENKRCLGMKDNIVIKLRYSVNSVYLNSIVKSILDDSELLSEAIRTVRGYIASKDSRLALTNNVLTLSPNYLEDYVTNSSKSKAESMVYLNREGMSINIASIDNTRLYDDPLQDHVSRDDIEQWICEMEDQRNGVTEKKDENRKEASMNETNSILAVAKIDLENRTIPEGSFPFDDTKIPSSFNMKIVLPNSSPFGTKVLFPDDCATSLNSSLGAADQLPTQNFKSQDIIGLAEVTNTICETPTIFDNIDDVTKLSVSAEIIDLASKLENTTLFKDKGNICKEDESLLSCTKPCDTSVSEPKDEFLKLRFNSQLNNLASKLEDTVTDIDSKFQELKSLTMTLLVTLDEVVLHDCIDEELKKSFKNRIKYLTLRFDETIKTIDIIKENMNRMAMHDIINSLGGQVSDLNNSGSETMVDFNRRQLSNTEYNEIIKAGNIESQLIKDTISNDAGSIETDDQQKDSDTKITDNKIVPLIGQQIEANTNSNHTIGESPPKMVRNMTIDQVKSDFDVTTY